MEEHEAGEADPIFGIKCADNCEECILTEICD